MNFSYFVAKRLAFSKGRSFTKTIVGIAIAAITISLAVMLLTNAMIIGFNVKFTIKYLGFKAIFTFRYQYQSRF
ncbi:MAG: hypothetical protein IPL23_24440 [Saprospiraceae bacterium]|nr:hypothetical protein [Saprospiraceae bacterium]